MAKMAGVYLFGKRQSKKVDISTRLLDQEVGKTAETITPIQGIMPDSVQEWRVAKALDHYKMSYRYQYAVYGGKQLAGGQVIDFLVYTVPLPTPVYVQGDYWHRSSKTSTDALKQARVKHLFSGQINNPVEIWEHEIPTVEDAQRIIQERLR